MSEYATVELVAGRGFLEGPRWHAGLLWISDLHRHEVLTVTPAGKVAALTITPLEISATRIRELLATGHDPRYLLPAGLAGDRDLLVAYRR